MYQQSENNYKKNRKSAYVSVFDDTINFALQLNSNLWTAEELNILQLCSEDSLSEGSRLILSRLSLRKSKWLKSTSIAHYIPYGSQPSLETTILFNQSLDILEQHGFIEYLTSKTGFETAFEAVKSCFLLDDLTILYKKLTTTKNINNSNKTFNKERLIESIYHAVCTQKTLFGQTLLHKFASTVIEILKDLSHISKSSHHIQTFQSNKAYSSKNIFRILRINPKILDLLRRCQRLYQISCNASNNGYSSTSSTTTSSSSRSNNYSSSGSSSALSTVINTSAATTGFASVLQPLEFNAPLLVFFQKVIYPQYVLRCGRGLISRPQYVLRDEREVEYVLPGANETEYVLHYERVHRCGKGLAEEKRKESPIFASQLGFLQWEGAVELHAACLDQNIEATLVNANNSRLLAIVSSFDSPYFCPPHTEPVAHPTGYTLSDSIRKSQWSLLPWLAEILSSALPQRSESNKTEVEVTNTTSISTSATTSATDDVKAPVKKKRNCSTIELTALSPAHLLSILCLVSYTTTQERGSSGGSSRPDYLLKFDAGTQLAYACSDGASQCEKEPYRQYTIAILLYELLLLLPYLPHRRGYWYKRLCINYTHLQLYRCALRACYRCQRDPLVNVSDKTDLSYRATVLQTRISKQQSGTTKVNKKVQHTSPPVCTTPKAVVTKVEQLSDNNLSLVLDFPSVQSIQSIETAAVIVKSEQPDSTMSIDEEQCGRRSKRTRSRAQAPVATTTDTAATTNTDTVTTTAAAPGMDGSGKVDIVSDSVEPLQVLYVVNMLPSNSSSASSGSGISSSSGSSLEEGNRDVSAQPLLEFISSFLTLTIVSSVTSNTKQQQLEHTTTTVRHFSYPITTTTNATSAWQSNNNSSVHRDIGNPAGTAWANASLQKHAGLTTATNNSRSNSNRNSSNKRCKLNETSHLTLSTSTTAEAQNIDKLTWSCIVCTFVNAPTQTIACAVCMHARPSSVKSPSAVHKGSTVLIAKPASAVNKYSAGIKTPMVSYSTNMVEVVDLLSEDEEVQAVNNEEVQVVEGVDNEEVQVLDKEVQVVEVNTQYKQHAAVNNNSTPSTTHKHAPSGTTTTSPLHKSIHYPTRAAISHLLHSIYQQQLTTAIKTITKQAKNLKTPSYIVDTIPNINTHLNICTTTLNNSDDEEESDLLLLDLLPHSNNTTISNTTNTEITHKKQNNKNIKNNMHISLEELIPAPPFFVVHGKRIGDPARKGKSKFCGRSGELLHVEEYVLEKCRSLDPDEVSLEDVSSSEDVVQTNTLLHQQEDQQQEQDCLVEDVQMEPTNHRKMRRRSRTPSTTPTDAVSVDQTVLGDIVEEEILPPDDKTLRQVAYTTAIDGGGWQGWHCEGAIFHTLFGLLMWDILFTCPCCPRSDTDTQCSSSSNSNSSSCAVFVTPFQDAPLDLGHRAFFRTRKNAILSRIAKIAAYSTEQMLTTLGGTYREHYGETCRGVSWGMTLPLLQLVAVCMGSVTVAAVCRAMAVNFKHFNGGAPDLLLVRVQRRIVRTMPLHCTDCGDGGVETAGVGEYAAVDLCELLGQDWAEQTYREVHLGTTRAEPDEVLPVMSNQSPSYRDTTKTANQVAADTEGSTLLESDSDEGVVAELTEETQWLDVPSVNPVHTNSPLYQKNMHIYDLFLPHLAPRPETPCISSSCRNCQGPISSTSIVYSYEYRLQARYVEVKGPTDTLMFRQRVWLHILNQATGAVRSSENATYQGTTVATDGLPLLQAYVCHVKE